MTVIVRWPTGADVYFNPVASPSPEGITEEAIKYAIWSWSARTGIDLRWKGLTDQTEIIGAIIVSWGTKDDFAAHGYTGIDYIKTRGMAARQPRIDGTYKWVKVYLNPLFWPESGVIGRREMRTVVHELGHSIGAEHLEQRDSVMNKNLLTLHPATYGLTCADFMPVQCGGNQSFVELTREYDLFIPCVMGQIADLEYIGDGTIHKWRLRSLRDAGTHQVESAVEPINMEKPDLVFTDVRSPSLSLSRVELSYNLSTEEWILQSAQ